MAWTSPFPVPWRHVLIRHGYNMRTMRESAGLRAPLAGSVAFAVDICGWGPHQLSTLDRLLEFEERVEKIEMRLMRRNP